jgi:hypothetical protein
VESRLGATGTRGRLRLRDGSHRRHLREA